MTREVAIVRTGSANMASVMAAFARLGWAVREADSPADVANAERLVLPGVGAFGAAMGAINRLGIADVLRARIDAGHPTLCICLGLQVLCESSDESPDVAGLAAIPARVTRFMHPTARVPQLGWNSVAPNQGCRFLRAGDAYYANSYRIASDRLEGWNVATTQYAGTFIAACERGGVLACQFHPELSGGWGADLLSRWLAQEGV